MNKLERKVNALETVLFVLIAWLHRDIGGAGVRELSKIYENSMKEGKAQP